MYSTWFRGNLLKSYFVTNQYFFVPIIEYGAFVYAGMSKQNDAVIEKIQRVFTRKLFRRAFNQNSAPFYA